MSEPASPAGSPIATEVILQLTAAAATIAAGHDEPTPATIAAAPTARAKALQVLFAGTGIPADQDAPSYAVVMTGHFASYRGAPPGSHVKLPRRGRCLVAVINASTLLLTDTGLTDQDHTSLLQQFGPVATLSQAAHRTTSNP